MTSYCIKQNNTSKTIYTELTLDELKEYLNEGKKVLIIKFGASWCVPCHNIKNLVENNYVEMPDNVLCFDIDVDESGDLFGHLFTKKMVKTLPALLVYYCNSERDYWYIADENISTSDKTVVQDFFTKIFNNCNK